MSDSTPTLSEFSPLYKQHQVIYDIRQVYDYNQGVHEVLLAGAVGSAKSILLAHLAVTHCLLYPNAHAGIGRRTLPSLRETLIEVIKSHLGEDIGYEYNAVKSQFKFSNGSVMRPFSWADRHYRKFRSHEFSFFGVEELTENADDEQEFYTEMIGRVGRLKHVNEKIVVNATNPDDPEHWVHKRFFVNKTPRRHVYTSKTSDNPHLPPSYIEGLAEIYDPKMYKRMVLAEWVSIKGDTIYHQYDPDKNKSSSRYTVDASREIHWTWDFNIGDSKPLSTCFFQHDGTKFHVFKDIVIHGLRTEDMLDEALGLGLLDYETTYVISGDATGKHKDTRSRHNDWEIIKLWLSNNKNKKGSQIRFRMAVPLSNPKVRDRHNIVNGQLHNQKGARNLIVYADAPKVHEGLMLTKLKKGAEYNEDDSKDYQHVTTALGYGIIAKLNESSKSTVTSYRR